MRPTPVPTLMDSWPEGETPCEAPGCTAEANFSVDAVFLCWGHMVPKRDAGETVHCLLKVAKE